MTSKFSCLQRVQALYCIEAITLGNIKFLPILSGQEVYSVLQDWQGHDQVYFTSNAGI